MHPIDNPVHKIIWLIETHLEGDLTLGMIADDIGMSRHYLLRAFAALTGQSVMRYVRNRRLSEAARKLVKRNGKDCEILPVALDAGYNSHEAFTRAFRDFFGITPEKLRQRGTLENLPFQEALHMTDTMTVDLDPPRFEQSPRLEITGFGQRYSCETSTAIPGQWQRFLEYLAALPGTQSGYSYGVCDTPDEKGEFNYICGMAADQLPHPDPDLQTINLDPRKYAVFTHRGHISGIRATVAMIWNDWLPKSGLNVAKAPDFECYSPDFNPDGSRGKVEIWIPIEED